MKPGTLIMVVTLPSGEVAVYGPFASQAERARWAENAVAAHTFDPDAAMHPTRVALPPPTTEQPLIGLPEQNGATR